MISVADALKLVLEQAQARQPVLRPLADAGTHVLAQDISCELDSPPHDKSLVDGYAVRAADVATRNTSLRVLEEVTAGQVPLHEVTQGTATRIMTGAPLPRGADAVVMIEQSDLGRDADGSEQVQLHDVKVTSGQNILRRGECMRAGDTVLKTGHYLRAIETGLLAELGIQQVAVFSQPSVAVLATGNELVPSTETPAAGQIRNSNSPMLCGMASEVHAQPIDLGIARDDASDLARLITRGLECDVLILSGGVSAGVLDLVPTVFKQLSVDQVFHKVDVKPGRPVWFGVRGRKDAPPNLVFGLPGNPVSSLVCFHLLVRPALARMAGGRNAEVRRLPARLTKEFTSSGNRPTYFPGRIIQTANVLRVEPLRWRGSADLRTLVDANALIYFPPGTKEFRIDDDVMVELL